MTESNNTEQATEAKHVLSFGEHLYIERKRQNLSIADVAKAIHLSEKVIDALERSDVSQLPQPAFVQGYLRAYAKYLDIPEALVLEEYAHAVPHKPEATLQPRSTLPRQASSSSPFVKIITILLLLMLSVAALYAAFSYYKKAIEIDDAESETQTSLLLPESDVSDVDEPQYDISLDLSEQDGSVETAEPEVMATIEEEVVAEPEKPVVEIPAKIEAAPQQIVELPAADKRKNILTADGEDVLILSAEQVSWVEVEDVNGVNLYYDLLPQEQSITLQGTAPFKIFLGNAPQVTVRLNDVAVNIKNHIRSNNIAQFSISVDQQQVIFH